MPKVDYLAELPERMKYLELDKHGRPVPWFVWWKPDGEPDFRVIGPGKREKALSVGLCWVCGQFMGSQRGTFVIGPMCCVNRTSAEPPSHRECAIYSAKHCPFLTVPKMHRRQNDIPEEATVDGHMIARNPGVTLVWTSRNWRPFTTNEPDGRRGLLFNIGDPEQVRWYAEGREATHAEVQHSIDTGLPALRSMAREQGPAAEEELMRRVFDAVATLPAS